MGVAQMGAAMSSLLVLGAAALFQALTKILAFRLIWKTTWQIPWTVIAITFGLLAVERSTELKGIAHGLASLPGVSNADLTRHWVSVFFFVGMILIGPMLVARERHEKELGTSQESLDALNDNLNRVVDEKTALESEKTELHGAKVRLESEAAVLREEKDALSTEAEALKGRTSLLESEVDGLKQTNAKLEADKIPLREASERFAHVFEESPIGMAMIRGGDGLWLVNKSLAAMLIYTKEDFIGKTLLDFVDPRDEELLGSDNDFMEIRLLRSDGYFIWTLLSRTSLRQGKDGTDYTIYQIQDITDRKLAEEAAAEGQAQTQEQSLAHGDTLSGMFEATHDLAILLDPQLHVITAKSRFCERIGVPPEELSARTRSRSSVSPPLPAAGMRCARLWKPRN